MYMQVLRLLTLTLCAAAALRADTIQALSSGVDAVVVGEVTGGYRNGPTATLTLRSDRALKGDFKPGALVNVVWNTAYPATGTEELPSVYGMWFLRAAGPSQWQLVPPRARAPLGLACYPLPSGSAPPSYGAAVSVPDAIMLELVAALVQLKPGASFYQVATAIIDSTPSPVTSASVQLLSQSGNLEIQAVGVTSLLRQRNVLGLQVLAAHPEITAVTMLQAQAGFAVSAFRDPAPQAVQLLGEIATSPRSPQGLQEAAGEALSTIHTKEALPFLAALLDSQDPKLRHQAVAGFSMFVESLPVVTFERVADMSWLRPQGPTPYRTADTDRYSASRGAEPVDQQPAYVAFWRSWWAKTQNQIGH